MGVPSAEPALTEARNRPSLRGFRALVTRHFGLGLCRSGLAALIAGLNFDD
jgi:hypothetical protein